MLSRVTAENVGYVFFETQCTQATYKHRETWMENNGLCPTATDNSMMNGKRNNTGYSK